MRSLYIDQNSVRFLLVNWSEYEAIQADIFDHLLAALPSFGLRLFQSLGGID